jgi:CspA family cold shock protein
MAEGTIKRLTDKGFGFIDTGGDKDMFFHSSNLEGVTYEELQEGQRVSYTEGRGPKGPRAENVKPVWRSWEEHSFSITEKQIWVIREVKIKAKGNNRRRPSLAQRKNENWKKKRRISKYAPLCTVKFQLQCSGLMRTSKVVR